MANCRRLSTYTKGQGAGEEKRGLGDEVARSLFSDVSLGLSQVGRVGRTKKIGCPHPDSSLQTNPATEQTSVLPPKADASHRGLREEMASRQAESWLDNCHFGAAM